jgi:phospholipid transport system transporter-binding protein
VSADAAVVLPARVTMADASAALRTLEAALATGSGPLSVDASGLVELDSAAVSLLLHVQRLAAARGRSLALRSPPAKLVALAELYGVAPLLSLPAAAPSSSVA